jgi:hypothetical protein
MQASRLIFFLKAIFPSTPQPDEVKHVLADVNADDREWHRRRFPLWLHAASPVHAASQQG